MDTRNADRDKRLRSNDFLDMDEYPQITFVSTAVHRSGDSGFDVTGDLTVKDVTKQVTIPFGYRGTATDPSATFASDSKARSPSTARTTASSGTPRSRPAASW
ncbi:YceI family protein [Streptomyces sp. NPDC002580]|uniref:YceI family protein n=1 Tax=Streptomyces sp. NPDC002580 TaxID=3364653 RepID=UPI00368421A2